jgi:hypothetical protein
MRRRLMVHPSTATRAPSNFVLLNGLDYPSNGDAGSDVQLRWSGAAMLPRVGHTSILWANLRQQAGYYALQWHTQVTGSWPASNYEFGTHPYPHPTGAVDSQGHVATTGSSSATNHWWELAGLGGGDWLANPGGSAVAVIKGQWYLQARQCFLTTVTTTNDTIRHRYYPDLLGNPSFFIQRDVAAGSLPGSPVSPVFLIGCSPWTVSGDTNVETPSGILRGFAQFTDGQMSVADMIAEGSSNSNSPVTAAGTASVWYINKNPTPADVGDKSGQGHHPSFNAGRLPSLWTNG